jgi:hypothetical protein
MDGVFLALLSLMVFSPPLLSALMARQFGRSFRRWFFIGCILPFIANIILFFLPPIQAVKEKSK